MIPLDLKKLARPITHRQLPQMDVRPEDRRFPYSSSCDQQKSSDRWPLATGPILRALIARGFLPRIWAGPARVIQPRR